MWLYGDSIISESTGKQNDIAKLIHRISEKTATANNLKQGSLTDSALKTSGM